MSSTDLDARRRKAGAFFDTRLKPLMAVTRSSPGFFPLGPEPRQASYYQPRKYRSMSREHFEQGAFSSPEGLGKKLETLWRAEGSASLVPLAREVAELARELRLSEAQTEEVSELIYVMF